MSVNLSVVSTASGPISKGSSSIQVIWAGIEATNWVNATVVSTDNGANIKTKWQRRMIGSTGNPYIMVGIDNDSGKSVTGFVVVMADATFAASGGDPGEAKMIVEEE